MALLFTIYGLIAFVVMSNVILVAVPGNFILSSIAGFLTIIPIWMYLYRFSLQQNEEFDRAVFVAYPHIKNFVRSEIEKLLPKCFMDNSKWIVQHNKDPNSIYASFPFESADCIGGKMQWRIDMQVVLADANPGTELILKYKVTPIPKPSTALSRRLNEILNRDICNKIIAHTTATFDEFLK